jgi:hypothetical protein
MAREDNRRVSNGEQVQRIAKLALGRGKSVDFTGYWPRFAELGIGDDRLQSSPSLKFNGKDVCRVVASCTVNLVALSAGNNFEALW